MPGAITDLLDRVTDTNNGRPVVSTLASPGKAIGATSINLTDATDWTTTTAIHFSIYKVNAQGYKDPTTQTDWKGVLAGTTISSLTLTGGTDQAYNIGDIVELTPTERWGKDLYDWATQDHDTQGRSKQLTDTNGNKILGHNPTASAVNDVAVANAATGNGPALTAEGADTNIDLLLGAKGPTGSPRFWGNYDGWTLDTDTWVYVSATSFKIAGKNVTARFPAGTKIKVMQSGVPAYFYVTSATFSTDTTVNITGGSDYTLATGFTVPSYSYVATPQGFPAAFNYSAVSAGLSVGSGTLIAQFSMVGKQVHIRFSFTLGSGSAIADTPTINYPVTPASGYVSEQWMGIASLIDSGVDIFPGGAVHGGSTFSFRYSNTTGGTNPVNIHSNSATRLTSTAPFTWASGHVLVSEFTYMAV